MSDGMTQPGIDHYLIFGRTADAKLYGIRGDDLQREQPMTVVAAKLPGQPQGQPLAIVSKADLTVGLVLGVERMEGPQIFRHPTDPAEGLERISANPDRCVVVAASFSDIAGIAAMYQLDDGQFEVYSTLPADDADHGMKRLFGGSHEVYTVEFSAPAGRRLINFTSFGNRPSERPSSLSPAVH